MFVIVARKIISYRNILKISQYVCLIKRIGANCPMEIYRKEKILRLEESMIVLIRGGYLIKDVGNNILQKQRK